MELWQVPATMNALVQETLRDLDPFERGYCPYWKAADQSIMHAVNESQKMVNDDRKFAVSLDVSQFHPEELDVHLDGRVLTVEGNQEHKTDNNFMNRSFVRKWVLSENADLEAFRSQLDDKGHLRVEAPKAPRRRVFQSSLQHPVTINNKAILGCY